MLSDTSTGIQSEDELNYAYTLYHRMVRINPLTPTVAI